MAMQEPGPEGFEERFEYVRPLRPLHFPVEAKVPESLRHLELRTALYQLLAFYLRGRASVASDQFVYYDASNPKACLAPDVYVKLGGPQGDIESWKTWERGTPDLAIEIGSRSDQPEEPWEEKLGRYHQLGVRELVRFDPRAITRLRVWDYVDGDLAERRFAPDSPVPCRVLSRWWVTVPHSQWGFTLRLSRDAEGHELVKNEVETEAEARRLAEERVRELEAELEQLGRAKR